MTRQDVKTAVMTLITICLMITAFRISPAASQDNTADNSLIVKQKIFAEKKLLVAENMQLTEAEASGFWPIYDEYQDELFRLRVRSLKLIGDYAEHYELMTDDVAKKLLNEYLSIERLRQTLEESYLPKFRQVLSDIKVARYFQIESKISAADNYNISKQIPLIRTSEHFTNF